MESKKYKGTIDRWWIEDYPKETMIEPHEDGCFVIRGFIFGHPLYFNGVWFRTSQVVSRKSECVEGAVVETLNSKYDLLTKRKEQEEV